MEVVLRQDVEKLGQMGDVVEVADGYARNYLLPRRLAVLATPANKAEIEKAREARRQREVAERERVENLAGRLDGFLCYIPVRATEKGHLFGSVGPKNVAEALHESGFETIRPSNVSLTRPIEETGDYPIEIMLHPEVRVTVTVRVTAEEEEEAEEEQEE